MTQRFDFSGRGHGGFRAMIAMETHLHGSGLEAGLIHLVKMRASQINGCAYCLDMHSKDARALGETEQRLYALNAWRETRFFSARERAALEWAEALTLVAQQGVSDELYQRVGQHFSEAELVDLTYVVATINAWNRLAIAAHADVGDYQPQQG